MKDREKDRALEPGLRSFSSSKALQPPRHTQSSLPDSSPRCLLIHPSHKRHSSLSGGTHFHPISWTSKSCCEGTSHPSLVQDTSNPWEVSQQPYRGWHLCGQLREQLAASGQEQSHAGRSRASQDLLGSWKYFHGDGPSPGPCSSTAACPDTSPPSGANL